jgi:AraC-like DNA-binding protein
VLTRKINEAITQLRDNPERSITEIAIALGFSSSQYFATGFRRIANRSPSDCRQCLRV